MRRIVARIHRRQVAGRLWVVNPGAGRAYTLIAAWTLYAGLALIVGSPERTSSASYLMIRQTGGPFWFGLVLTVLGVSLLAAPWLHLMVMRLALLADCAVHVILGASFGVSAYTDHRAGLLAPGLYLVVLLWCVSQAEIYRDPRR